MIGAQSCNTCIYAFGMCFYPKIYAWDTAILWTIKSKGMLDQNFRGHWQTEQEDIQYDSLKGDFKS